MGTLPLFLAGSGSKNILEPTSGTLADIACGSGGMFAQSGDFANSKGMSNARKQGYDFLRAGKGGIASTVSKVIGSLAKGKTYYVRIRTFKTVGSTKYFSAWGSVKSVKITK